MPLVVLALQIRKKATPARLEPPGVRTTESVAPWPLESTTARRSPNFREVLDSPEVLGLIAELEALRWTGRPGYPVRAMVGMALAKAIYALPTWTRIVRLVAEHDGLRRVLGCAPSEWACYRFAREAARALRRAGGLPGSRDRGSCASGFPRWAVTWLSTAPTFPPTRTASGSSPRTDPSARSSPTPTPRGATAPQSRLARAAGSTDTRSTRPSDRRPTFRSRGPSKRPRTPSRPSRWRWSTRRRRAGSRSRRDHGQGLRQRADPHGLHGSRRRSSHRARRKLSASSAASIKPPCCEHGTWTFAGADYKRKATKWRCPTGDCTPASVWIKADRLHPLIPRESKRSKALYSARGAVEREFGRLKHEWSLLPLRVRGLDRVRLHADLTILAKLASRLAQERAALPLAA